MFGWSIEVILKWYSDDRLIDGLIVALHPIPHGFSRGDLVGIPERKRTKLAHTLRKGKKNREWKIGRADWGGEWEKYKSHALTWTQRCRWTSRTDEMANYTGTDILLLCFLFMFHLCFSSLPFSSSFHHLPSSNFFQECFHRLTSGTFASVMWRPSWPLSQCAPINR